MSRSSWSQAATLAAGLVLTVVGLGVSSPAEAIVTPIPIPNMTVEITLDLDEFEVQLMSEINLVRAGAGLPRIRRFDSCVDQLSETWAQRLAASGTFEHRNQHQVLRRCHQSWAGENLVRANVLTPVTTVRAWMASPDHRAVLLKRRASRAGVAVVRDSSGGLVGVLNLSDVS
jgi:uncharacterized protein YkwD